MSSQQAFRVFCDEVVGDCEWYVRRKCNKLFANDCTSVQLEAQQLQGGYLSDDEWRVLANAIKESTTLEELNITDLDLPTEKDVSATATLHLAGAILDHPKLKFLNLAYIRFTELNTIALAISKNKRMTRLRMHSCVVTPTVTEALRFLVKENALETLELYDVEFVDSNNNDQAQVDLGEALSYNRSLKKLSISIDTTMTLEGIARLLEVNQVLEELELDCSQIENTSDQIALVVRSANGHEVLKKLEFYGVGELERNTVQAVVDMTTTNAPALRELTLAGYYVSKEEAFLVANALSSDSCVLKRLSVRLDGFTSEICDAFLTAVERNTTLENLYLYDERCRPEQPENLYKTRLMSRANHLLTLNRGGRRILRSESDVPRSLWPLVLAKSANKADVITSFSRRNPTSSSRGLLLFCESANRIIPVALFCDF